MSIKTYWGETLDVDADRWVLAGRFVVDFGKLRTWSDGSDPYERALRSFLATCAKRELPRSIQTYFIIIEYALRDEQVRASIPSPDESFILAVAKRFAKSKKVVATRVSVLRRWYRFAEAKGFEGFDADAAMLMDAMHIAMPRFGTAVMRADTRHGPLSNAEYDSLMAALWKARAEKSLPLPVLCVALLTATFGVNPENLMKLREADLTDRRSDGGYRILSMPRIKKRIGNVLGTHRDRPLVPELEAVLEDLVAENRAAYPEADFPDSDEAARPLLIRSRDLGYQKPTLVPKAFIYNLISGLPDLLSLEDDEQRTLKLYPRRLRYTFASRHVAAGRTPEQLQDLLDHSSIECLLVYYNPRWDLVDRLDGKVGPQLEAFAGMAMGARPIPVSEARPVDAIPSETAPFACLTCRSFRPVKTKALEAIAAIAMDRVAASSGAGPSGPRDGSELDGWTRVAVNAPRARAAIERAAIP